MGTIPQVADTDRCWQEGCSKKRVPGYTLCRHHLDEWDKELDQIAAMSHLGCDEYGSLP